MNKQTIINSLSDNYNSFVKYISELTPEEYSYSFQQKWTAGQQLEHIVLCMKPILQVFSMDKEVIAKTFGRTDRRSVSYESLLTNYKEKLTAGGKAPDRFIPLIISEQREVLCKTLLKIVGELGLKIETFSDEELDGLQIPHPLLGNLTLREMLYNTIYHVRHHQNLAEIHLMQLKLEKTTNR